MHNPYLTHKRELLAAILKTENRLKVAERRIRKELESDIRKSAARYRKGIMTTQGLLVITSRRDKRASRCAVFTPVISLLPA